MNMQDIPTPAWIGVIMLVIVLSVITGISIDRHMENCNDTQYKQTVEYLEKQGVIICNSTDCYLKGSRNETN